MLQPRARARAGHNRGWRPPPAAALLLMLLLAWLLAAVGCPACSSCRQARVIFISGALTLLGPTLLLLLPLLLLAARPPRGLLIVLIIAGLGLLRGSALTVAVMVPTLRSSALALPCPLGLRAGLALLRHAPAAQLCGLHLRLRLHLRPMHVTWYGQESPGCPRPGIMRIAAQGACSGHKASTCSNPGSCSARGMPTSCYCCPRLPRLPAQRLLLLLLMHLLLVVQLLQQPHSLLPLPLVHLRLV